MTYLPSIPITPESQNHGGVVSFSVADRCGTTIAVHKRNSEDLQWGKIGSNLIAYWAGDGGSIQCYLNAVAKMIPSTKSIGFRDLIYLNENSDDILPLDEWNSSPITVNLRDRLEDAAEMHNLLTMVISKKSISMANITATSSALGSGAPAALKVLDNYSGITSCEMFDTNEVLQKHIVSKAMAKAVITTDATYGFCEVLRGCPDNPWDVVKEINLDDLLNDYAPPTS